MRWVSEYKPMLGAIQVWGLQEIGQQRNVIRYNAYGHSFHEPVEQGVEAAPTFIIPMYDATALCTELLTHVKLPMFQLETQREDYMHERSRVDKLIDHFMTSNVIPLTELRSLGD